MTWPITPYRLEVINKQLTKGIYKAHVSDNTRKGRPRRAYISGEFFLKVQVRSTHHAVLV